MLRSERRISKTFLTALAAAAGLSLGTAPPNAQTVEPTPPPPAEARPATPQIPVGLDEFRALVEGRTLYFELEDGRHWGREYYRPGTQESVFVYPSGECLNGHWEKVGDRFCYYYRERPSCWLTFWEDGALTVISRSGMRQRVSKIVEAEPISCEAPLLSSAPSLTAQAAP